MLENQNVVWGTNCDCGKKNFILQDKAHPWAKTDFSVTLTCECGNNLTVTQKEAFDFYNEKIFSCFKDVSGTVLDLGCGGGFITQYVAGVDAVKKVYAYDISDSNVGTLEKVEFIKDDIIHLCDHFSKGAVDYVVHRDLFMYIFDTTEYFNDVTTITKKGIFHLGWYMKHNDRMQNQLTPEEIKEEMEKRGWEVTLEYLDWYKCGYYIKAIK